MSAAKREVVGYAVRVAQGVSARVYVNDLPLFRDTLCGGDQKGGLNDRLVPGENELAIEVLWAEPPNDYDGAPPANEEEARVREKLRHRVMMHIYREKEPEDETIYRGIFPDWLADVPEERHRVPYHHVVTFDPGIDVYRLAFLDAPSVDVPCEGTPELRAAVDELFGALKARDKSRLVDLMRLQIEEYAGAFEGHGVSVTSQIQAYDEFFADDLDVLVLDRAQLHFRSRAQGRVVEVTRLDGLPVLGARMLSESFVHESNLLFTQVGGRWCLM